MNLNAIFSDYEYSPSKDSFQILQVMTSYFVTGFSNTASIFAKDDPDTIILELELVELIKFNDLLSNCIQSYETLSYCQDVINLINGGQIGCSLTEEGVNIMLTIDKKSAIRLYSIDFILDLHKNLSRHLQNLQ